MSSLQKEPKIYGAVESQSFITFTGFCKRIYDPTQQSVDVFIDDVKIDTILANQKIRDIENKYEVFDTNGFCFTYQLPKEYIGKKHKLEFKTQEGEQLLHSPTHTIDQFSPLYNQVIFIESLKEPLKYSAIDNGYTKNALSFIAIEENLSDEGFIEFVLEMCKKYKELSLSIVYFNEHQKHQATKVFSQVKQKNFFNPSSVQEIIKSSEIYLHNVVDEFRFTLNEEYYNKVKNVQAIKENLFTIELTRKAKKKKAMVEMEVDTVTPIMFETSVISEMFKDDGRYNEFVFVNNVSQSIDKSKITNLYQVNSIGFFAIKETLKDDHIMEYLKDLMNKFPNAKFKGFYFNDKDKEDFEKSLNGVSIEFLIPKDTYSICNEIEILVASSAVLFNGPMFRYNQLVRQCIKYNPNLFIFFYNDDPTFKSSSLLNMNPIKQESKQFEILTNALKLDTKFIEKHNYNFWVCIIEYFLTQHKTDLTFNYELSRYDIIYIDFVEAIFKSQEFKIFLCYIRKLLHGE